MFYRLISQLFKTTSFRGLLTRRTKTYITKQPPPAEIVIETGKLQKDVLLYAHNDRKHFGILLACSTGAAFFFISTAESFRVIGKTLREKKRTIPIDQQKSEMETTRWGINLWKFKDGSLHDVFAGALYLIGISFIVFTMLAPAKHLRSVVLMKDGERVCLSTYAPYGKNKHQIFNINQVHASPPYVETRSAFIKTSKHRIPYFLSTRGQVLNRDKLRSVLKAN